MTRCTNWLECRRKSLRGRVRRKAATRCGGVDSRGGFTAESSMYTFFHGWRRKAGVVSLLIAIAMIGGWIRSRFILDCVQLRDRDSMHQLDSFCGCVRWLRFDLVPQARRNNLASPFWASRPIDIRQGQVGFRWDQDNWAVPFWSITLPLTLLSAYLILWKPRKRVNSDA
jgi:hypothetical protein